MANIFVISDTHFNHANIIKFCNRPFVFIEDMDWKMVDNWNSVVKKDDLVYHLGDVYFKASKGYIENVLGHLNGRKRLILGNHDNGNDQILHRFFEKISLWKKFPDEGLIFTHLPMYPGTFGDMVNCHGHIHQNPSPEGPYRNMCVEVNNYTPVSIEDLKN